MDSIKKAERLKILVAVEKFKSELAQMNLDEVEIQDALDDALSRTYASNDLISALRTVADERIMKRTKRWDSETRDANSSIAVMRVR